MPKLGEALLQAFKTHGAHEIFGIPGDFVLPFFKVIEESATLPFYIDTQTPLVTLASATGLTAFGTVRPLDQPHFTENYILREMGYQIARRHAAKLRYIAVALAFFIPSVLALLAAFDIAPAITTTTAALLALIGLLVERWLFFAEATHVATIYYGR